MNDYLEVEAPAGLGRPHTAGAPWWARDLVFAPTAALGAVMALAAFLRFGLLGRNSLWFDEIFVYHIIQMNWRDMLAGLRFEDAHPPLYYAFMKCWAELAGTGEIALRIPSACFSTASVWLTYCLARRLASERVALLAALVAAVSPFQIMAGQEARMYPLLEMLALASTLLLWMCLEGGWAPWTGYGVVTALMVYTHYLSVLVIASQGLWLLSSRRRVFLPWLAAVGAACVPLLPWAPSLWYQATAGHVWAWYRHPLTPSMPGDLLGLFAFGGSLFGFGTYFVLGSRPPLEQLILLLPFLVIVWWGARATAFQQRAGGLIGIVFALPIGGMLLLSLWKPMFYMRWFSFLGGFYAILMAAGVLALADRFHGRRDRIVAMLLVGLLAYSVPVLAAYYLDPNFRPYNWRAAAASVRERIRPGDLLLYNGDAAEIAFTYYFHGHNSSLVLTPIEALPPGTRRPTFDSAWVRRLSAQYPRVWVIATVPFSEQMQHRLESDLQVAYRLVGIEDYKDVWVTLTEVKTSGEPR